MAYSNSSPSAPPNSSLAVVSLIAGILGLTLFPTIGSIVALITGSMAKREIAQSGDTLGGDGLARAGIILGWIGIALTVFGLCVAGFVIGLPLCLTFFGIAAEEFGILFPLLNFI